MIDIEGILKVRHVGDLGNIFADKDGLANINVVDRMDQEKVADIKQCWHKYDNIFQQEELNHRKSNGYSYR